MKITSSQLKYQNYSKQKELNKKNIKTNQNRSNLNKEAYYNYYSYIPHINFKAKQIKLIELNQKNIKNLFKGKDLKTKLTSLAIDNNTNIQNLENIIINTLNRIQNAKNIELARSDFPRFCSLVLKKLHPLIASYICQLEITENNTILESFNLNKQIKTEDWDFNTFTTFFSFNLDYKLHINRFKEIKNNTNLPDSTIAWCIKLNLDDKQIETFLKEKQNNLNISDEELLFCIANNITSKKTKEYPNKNILRYIELRNREYTYIFDNTVRGQGGKYFYPVKLAMLYTLKNLSDNDINIVERRIKEYLFKLNMLQKMFKEPNSLKDIPLLDFEQYPKTLNPVNTKILTNNKGEKVFLIRENEKKRIVLPLLEPLESKLPTDLSNAIFEYIQESKYIKAEEFFSKIIQPYSQQTSKFNEKFYQILKSSKNNQTNSDITKDLLQPLKMLELKDFFKRKAGDSKSYFSFNNDEYFLINKWYFLQKIPNITDVLSIDTWYQAHTNTDQSSFIVISEAIKKYIGLDKTSDNIQSENLDIKELIKNINLPEANLTAYADTELSFDSSNSILKYNGQDKFEVKVFPITIQDKPAVLFSDDKKTYLAYRGAIVELKEPYTINKNTKNSLKNYTKIAHDKQLKVLEDAIRYFPVNILDEDNNIVIGKGFEKKSEYTGTNKTTEETKKHYGLLLKEMKDEDKLNVINILKIMPIDANISINPCITDGGNILYSISSEWTDLEKTNWELRIHSTDLHYNDNNANWITRCGYTKIGEETKYLSENNNKITGDFNGTYNSQDSHIRIESPIEDSDSLLNNIHFQNIAHQISLNIEEINLIKKICSKMSIAYEKNNLYKNIKEILNKANQNLELYAKNKTEIDEIRSKYGYLKI